MAGEYTELIAQHAALLHQYRGSDGTTVDNNYNWWSATGAYPVIPDADLAAFIGLLPRLAEGSDRRCLAQDVPEAF